MKRLSIILSRFKNSADRFLAFVLIVLFPSLSFPLAVPTDQSIEKKTLSNCSELETAYSQNHDANIQSKLHQLYQNDACFKQGGKKIKNFMSDNTIGPFEKTFDDLNLEPIQLSAIPGCNGCSLPMERVTYGFYPYWQASSADKKLGIQTINPAAIDFSVFKRIAYLAIPIKHDGEIKNRLHWENIDDIQGFVQTLSKYNVKRDLVLYSNSWENWDSGGFAIEGFAEQHKLQIIELHKSVEEFGGLSGITLFFDGYSNNSIPDNIYRYIKHLYKKITEDQSVDFDINLMLGIEWDKESCRAVNISSPELTYFNDIEGLLLNEKAGQLKKTNLFEKILIDLFSSEKKVITDPPIKNLLVFLNEPTSKAKKCLRLQIENEFRGQERVHVLRKVIPVLGRIKIKQAIETEQEGNDSKAEKDEFEQFKDDMVYLKDNFGGIGLWPLPMQHTAASQETEEETTVLLGVVPNPVIPVMSSFLKQDYIAPFNYGIIGGLLHQKWFVQDFPVCSVVCPNRTLFKYFFLLILAVSGISFVAFRVNCKAQKFIIKLKWFYIGLKFVTVLAFIAILGCDPVWQPQSNLILSVFGLFIIAVYIYELSTGSLLAIKKRKSKNKFNPFIVMEKTE